MATKTRGDHVPPREKPSAYTIDFPKPVWHNVKALAALRGQSIREFLQTTVHAELDRAVQAGEFQLTRFADLSHHRA